MRIRIQPFQFHPDPDPDPHQSDTVRLHFEPLKPLNFDFNVDPDLAFHSNAIPDSDSSLQNNADPDLV
jgi:hypothetical protein